MTVTEEACQRLAAKKGSGESFSSVIMNLTGKASLFDLVGAISKENAAEVRRKIGERRRQMRATLQGKKYAT